MTTLSKLAFEIGLAVGSIVLLQLFILLFRNPLRPQWMHKGIVVEVATVGIIGLLVIAFGLVISGLVESGVHAFLAIIFAAALVVITVFAGARFLRLRARLERSDAGESPFGLVRGDAQQQHQGRPS
jgi:hypothetical protein